MPARRGVAPVDGVADVADCRQSKEDRGSCRCFQEGNDRGINRIGDCDFEPERRESHRRSGQAAGHFLGQPSHRIVVGFVMAQIGDGHIELFAQGRDHGLFVHQSHLHHDHAQPLVGALLACKRLGNGTLGEDLGVNKNLAQSSAHTRSFDYESQPRGGARSTFAQ